MNEEKQIEEMAKVIKCRATNSLQCPRTTCAICKATEMYNAGYRKQSEWISVDERLPDLEPTLIKYGSMGYKQKSVRVLCACKQKSGKVMVKEGYYEVWVENPSHACWRIPGSIDSVTHWMPLPNYPLLDLSTEDE